MSHRAVNALGSTIVLRLTTVHLGEAKMVTLDYAVKTSAHGLARIVAQEMTNPNDSTGDESRCALAIELTLKEFARAILEQAVKAPAKIV